MHCFTHSYTYVYTRTHTHTDSPVIPQIRHINATSSRSFELSWTFSGNMNQVSHYVIRVLESVAPFNPILDMERSVDAVTQVEVSNSLLLPYTDYYVIVVVVFSDASIPVVTSDRATVKTGIAVPLDAPRNFTIQTKGVSTLQLSWKVKKNYFIRGKFHRDKRISSTVLSYYF